MANAGTPPRGPALVDRQPDALQAALLLSHAAVSARASAARERTAAARRDISKGVAADVLTPARKATSLLGNAAEVAAGLREGIAQTTKACKAAADADKLRNAAVDDEAMRNLATARANLGLVLRDVEGIAAIPYEADAAERLLEPPPGGDLADCDLPAAHARLVALVGASRLAREAVLRQARNNDSSVTSALSALGKSFARARRANARLTAALWARVRGMRDIALEKPQALLQAAFVIEMQRKVDNLLRDAGVADATGAAILGAINDDGTAVDVAPAAAPATDGKAAPPEDWVARCRYETRMAVADAFQPLDNALAAWDRTCVEEDDGARAAAMEAVLTEGRAAVKALDDIQRVAAPSFPPHMRVDAAAELAGLEHVGRLLAHLGASAEAMSLGEVLEALELAAAMRARRAALSAEVAAVLDSAARESK